MAYDCFISYNRRDAALAEQLSQALALKGISTWWDSELKKAVNEWVTPLVKALEDSKALVVIVSQNSVERETEVMKEVNYAKTNGKPVIPIFAGDIPTNSALYFAVQLYQRVTTSPSFMEENAIEEIVFKLKNFVDDQTPKTALKDLNLTESDLPSWGTLDTALHRACHRHLVDSIKKRDFAEVWDLLREIRRQHIEIKAEATENWLKWVEWYENTRQKSKTWAELARSLATELPSQVDSPAALQAACRPVALSLEAEFWRIFEKSVQIFLRSITTATWVTAARSLQALDPALLNPLAGLVEGVEVLTRPARNSFAYCAQQVLALYSVTPVGPQTPLDALLRAPFPPDETQLRSVRKLWDAPASRMEFVHQFANMLGVVAAKSAGVQSVCDQLSRVVTQITEDTNTESPLEFTEVLRLAKLWDATLESLTRVVEDSQALAPIESSFMDAGRIFPEAKVHAKLVRDYRSAAGACAQAASNGLTVLIDSLANKENATVALHEKLLSPLQAHWQTLGEDRPKKVQLLLDGLNSQRERSRRQSQLLLALEPLSAGNPESASKVLQKLVRDDPEIASLAGPWLKVAEAIKPLYGVSAGKWQSLLDSDTGLLRNFFDENAGKSQSGALLNAAERANRAIGDLARNGFPPVEAVIPDHATITYLSCLKEVLDYVSRGDWHSAERKLSAYISEEAEPPDFAWTLLQAIRKFVEAPVPYNLEGLLTTPVTRQPGKEPSPAPRSNSEANQLALFAMCGQVETVSAALRSIPDYVPHNLCVAIVLSTRKGPAGTFSRHLPVLISACALFACNEKYRESLAQAFTPSSLESFAGKGLRFRNVVGMQLKSWAEGRGESWGTLQQSESWACRWEVECFAVSQMSLQAAHAPLPWPFGPHLIEFYGLRRELSELLQRNAALRVWYGPCAAAAALNFSGNAEGAIRSLPHAGEFTQEQARALPGYAHLKDPLPVLQEDIDRLRGDILLRLLNRDHFTAETMASESSKIEQDLIAHSRELLELRERNKAIDEPFIHALNAAFATMVEQLESPEINLRRAATIEDAENRRRCMDGVIAFLLQLPDREWLTNCIASLRSLRSDVTRTLATLKLKQWKEAGKPSAILNQMLELAEDAIRDDPNDPNARILKARVMLLDPDMLEASAAYVRTLQSNAAVQRWPPQAIKEIQELFRRLDEEQREE